MSQSLKKLDLVVTPGSVRLVGTSAEGMLLELTPPAGGNRDAVAVRFCPETFPAILQGIAACLASEPGPDFPEARPEETCASAEDEIADRWLRGHDDLPRGVREDVTEAPNVFHGGIASWPKDAG